MILNNDWINIIFYLIFYDKLIAYLASSKDNYITL